MSPTVRQRVTALGTLLGGCVIFAVLHLHPGLLEEFGPGCVFNRLTHLYCQGCGGTRSATLLLRGDLLGALRMNVFAVIVMGCAPVGLVWTLWTGRSVNWAGATGRPGKLIAAFVIAFFVLRNVPVKPFTYLAPIPLKIYDHINRV